MHYCSRAQLSMHDIRSKLLRKATFLPSSSQYHSLYRVADRQHSRLQQGGHANTTRYIRQYKQCGMSNTDLVDTRHGNCRFVNGEFRTEPRVLPYRRPQYLSLLRQSGKESSVKHMPGQQNQRWGKANVGNGNPVESGRLANDRPEMRTHLNADAPRMGIISRVFLRSLECLVGDT